MVTPVPSRSAATRALILDVAAAEFSTHGYRRSSVDSVSRRAGVSRATLYQYWRSKEQLFRALVEHLHEQHLSAMQAVLDDPPGGPVENLAAILQARFGRFVALTSTSGNADELYDVHDRVCGDIALAAEQRGRDLIAQLLRRAIDDGQLDLSAAEVGVDQAAALLIDCAHAAKGPNPAAATPAEFAVRIAQLMRLVVNGLRPGPDRPTKKS
ncbi:TetR/AcrR family transcriptional regulator [Amorphoplanes nipponensis]|uniref:TetR family transcriptional regulator n=1 Tax=Actinoplanes nipponensis TaxID=135950 RepID=A0A919JI99_9ACTN|nr:TetR/AcrR family transcriptional regulator [Actinoplanes nipponensis]GIE47304.1 TetR family transcriptional regulator [Actinoplanes nipponensis]